MNEIGSAGVAPQEPCPQPCEHLSAEDAREGRDCREHPCTCPTAPSSDREKLVEEARAVAGPKSLYAHTSVAHLLIRLADALAAQPVKLDAEKVAEVLLLLMRDGAMLFDNGTEEWIAESDPVECLPPLARALCVAYTEGKLQ